jgi:hypothetical protein
MTKSMFYHTYFFFERADIRPLHKHTGSIVERNRHLLWFRFRLWESFGSGAKSGNGTGRNHITQCFTKNLKNLKNLAFLT